MLLIKKIKIQAEYSDFLNGFLEKKTLMLLELTKLNQYTIKLQDDKQLFYRLIYSLRQIELKLLKTYIKTNLANSFIYFLKSLANAFIFFLQKPNNNL